MPRRHRASDGEELEAITVSSIPPETRRLIEDIAASRSRGGTKVHGQDIYVEALRELFQELDRGASVAWLAPERNGGRLMFWAPVEVSERMRQIKTRTRRTLTVILLAALRGYFDRRS